MMNLSTWLRQILFTAGLTAITLSVVLQQYYARDANGTPVPEPGTLPLLALGGVVGIALALAGRRKK